MNALDEVRTISVDEAARLLGIHVQTAYKLARSNKLPGAVRLGRRVRVRLATLRAWLEEQERRPQAGAE